MSLSQRVLNWLTHVDMDYIHSVYTNDEWDTIVDAVDMILNVPEDEWEYTREEMIGWGPPFGDIIKN